MKNTSKLTRFKTYKKMEEELHQPYPNFLSVRYWQFVGIVSKLLGRITYDIPRGWRWPIKRPVHSITEVRNFNTSCSSSLTESL